MTARDWIEQDGFWCLAGYTFGQFYGSVVINESDDDHVMTIGPNGVECTCNIATDPNQLDSQHTMAFQACYASVRTRALFEIRNDLAASRSRREEDQLRRSFGT